MAAPPPPPSLKSCPKCGQSNLADNVYCGKCGGAMMPGVSADAATSPAKFPRSLIALSAARLVISATMLAILLFFFIMFMALVGNLGNLGGGGNCPTGEKWDDQQKKCVPDGGGGNDIDIQSVDVQTQAGWMQLDGQATCTPCQSSAGDKVQVKFNLRNTDSTDHQVTGITIQTGGFSMITVNPNLPAQVMASASTSFTLELNTPNQSWSGTLQISVQGN